jgi:hypothetical protein
MTHHHAKGPQAAHPQFAACTVLGHTPIFSRPEPAQKVLDVLRGLTEAKRLTVYAYVLLEDNLYLLASAVDLAKEIQHFQAATAPELLRLLDASDMSGMAKRIRRCQEKQKTDPAAQLWQDGPSPEIIKGHEMMQAKIDFIHQYPVKRGYVAEAALYRYSSARNYAGQPGLLPVTTEW